MHAQPTIRCDACRKHQWYAQCLTLERAQRNVDTQGWDGSSVACGSTSLYKGPEEARAAEEAADTSPPPSPSPPPPPADMPMAEMPADAPMTMPAMAPMESGERDLPGSYGGYGGDGGLPTGYGTGTRDAGDYGYGSGDRSYGYGE